MVCRTYDIVLDCGCMLSLDGGGGLMPCYYDVCSSDEYDKHSKAWDKYKNSPEYKEHQKEIIERNK